MNGTTRATRYGYSLWEFQVFTGGGTRRRPPRRPPARPSRPDTPTSARTCASSTRPRRRRPSRRRSTQVFNAQQEPDQFGTPAPRVPRSSPAPTDGSRRNIGFYTSIAGLGLNPDDVTINGDVTVDAGWFGTGNATQNFWRSTENLSIVPVGGTNRWAVSQAAPMRRMHIQRQPQPGSPTGYGWASGGYIADSVVDGTVASVLAAAVVHPRQPDRRLGRRRLEHGVLRRRRAPRPTRSRTRRTPRSATTPVIREKPYLYVDGAGSYRGLRARAAHQRRRRHLGERHHAGTSIPLSQFYVAKPGDSAATDQRRRWPRA